MIKITLPYVISGIMAFGGIGQTSQKTVQEYNDTPQKKVTMEYIPHFCWAIDNVHYKPDTVSQKAPRPISAKEHNKKLLYICDTGDTICRTGGSRAWRNFNPGCIVDGPFARENGAIGKGGRFAVFPDEETGRAALVELLRGKGYANLTIERAIIKYAPPYENDVGLYKRRLSKLTGLPLHLKLNQLSHEQMERVVDAITVIEGWTPGKETKIVGTPAKQTQKTELALAQFNTIRHCMPNKMSKIL